MVEQRVTWIYSDLRGIGARDPAMSFYLSVPGSNTTKLEWLVLLLSGISREEKGTGTNDNYWLDPVSP